MRVCMIVRNPCVRDPRVLKEARALAAAGHQVSVIATAEPGIPEAEERDGFRIRRVEPVPSWVRRVARRPVIPMQGGEGDPAVSGGSGLAKRPAALVSFRDALVTRQLTGAALATPADVYHAHDLNTLAAGVAAARRHRARLVYDAHEIYPELAGLGAGERARWGRLERKLIGRPDAIIVPSESRADEFARRYGIARPHVVMNCPPAGPAPDPKAGPLAPLRRPGELLAVYAGGYTANRGLENLIRATGLVDGVRLAMLGFGSVEAELRAIATRERLERVVFCPPVAHDEVVGASAAADVGMAPYLPVGLNNILAAPNKLFEYLHAGLAIAGSDLPDIRRVVEEHRVGTLFEAADPGSIAAAFQRLASDPAELTAMRDRARAAAPRYSWEGQEKVLLGVYEELGA